MTQKISKAASDALSDMDLPRTVSGYEFLKSCAIWTGVPHSEAWQLHHIPDAIYPWRIVDHHAASESDRTSNTAITFIAASPACLYIEMEAYAKALRGITEIREKGFSSDLMAASRRP